MSRLVALSIFLAAGTASANPTVQQIPESQVPRIGKMAHVELNFSSRAGIALSTPGAKVELIASHSQDPTAPVLKRDARIIANFASGSFRSRELAALPGAGPLTMAAKITYSNLKGGSRTEHIQLGAVDYGAHQKRNVALEDIDYTTK